MKKTLTVNLNGRIFHIDEDAYELLDKYLSNLHIYFRKEEGVNEIIADFEARIEELFSNYISLGNEIITIEYTEKVIKQVGKPEDFEIDTESEVKNKEQQTYSKSEQKIRKKLYRDSSNKLLGGVCSGIAAYLGWDATWIRLAIIVLVLFSVGWLIPAYIIMWIIVPEANTAEEKLEMRGKKVTLENIGKTVSEEVSRIEKNESAKSFFAVFFKACLIMLGLLVGGPLLFTLLILLIVLISVIFGVGGSLISLLPLSFIGSGDFIYSHPIPILISIILVIGIPLFSILYSIISFFVKFKPIPKALKWIFSIIWVISFISLVVLGAKFVSDNDFKFENREVHLFRKCENDECKGITISINDSSNKKDSTNNALKSDSNNFNIE